MIKYFRELKANKLDNARRLPAAKQLLETPMFNELIDTFEKRYFTIWYHSNISEKETREIAYIQLQTIRELKDHLQNIIKHDKLKN
jgi:hypothetical protein